MTEHLVILAPGLLGGSVARAARARGLARRITVWARRPETRHALESQPWVDAVADTPAEAVATATLVVLAAPVEAIIALAGDIAAHLPAGALVTDVGSVKAAVCRDCRAALPAGVHFIGAHPMAGAEKTGWENSREDLFNGRVCFVTPQPGDDPAVVATVSAFWRALGSEVVALEPGEHDAIVARISHLPQALATTLAITLAAADPTWRRLAGGGLRDTTRIAASDPEMWVEIFRQNRDEIMTALEEFQTELDGVHSALANQDWPELRACLNRGKAWRDGFKPLP